MLRALSLAVAAVYARVGRCAGLFFIVHIAVKGVFRKIMEVVNIVIGIGFKDLGDVDAFGPSVAKTWCTRVGNLADFWPAPAIPIVNRPCRCPQMKNRNLRGNAPNVVRQ